MAPPGHRAVAFSAKAKKKQLQNKREQNRHKEAGDDESLTRKPVFCLLFVIQKYSDISGNRCLKRKKLFTIHV